MRNRSENQIKLFLIRHGATASNAEHRYLGKTDEVLSEEGKRQLQEAQAAKRYPQVQMLFSSPMKRCLESAKILYPGMEPVVIGDWCETDFGDFEGKNYKELQKDAQYQAWIDSNGSLPFPNGESRETFIARCKAGLNRMLEHLQEMPDEKDKMFTVGAIVHGGTIMALLSSYGNGTYFDYQVPNGGGYQCCLSFEGEEIHITDIHMLGE